MPAVDIGLVRVTGIVKSAREGVIEVLTDNGRLMKFGYSKFRHDGSHTIIIDRAVVEDLTALRVGDAVTVDYREDQRENATRIIATGVAT